MSQWFRWFRGTCEDLKFRVTASNAGVTVAAVTGVWAALLEDASHPDHRGSATRSRYEYVELLGLNDTILDKIIEWMTDLKMVNGSFGNLTLTNWNKRQFESDGKDPTNAERQQRYRNAHRNGSNGVTVTDDNALQTVAKHQKQKQKQKQNTEKNTHALVERTRADMDFDDFWTGWPKRAGGNPKADAQESFRKAVKEGADPADIIAGRERYAAYCIAVGNVGTQYVKSAVAWLNKKMWKEEWTLPVQRQREPEYDPFAGAI